MKRLLFLILLCFSALMLAQTPNWTNVKETNINVANAFPEGFVDIFTNRYGNHIIVQEDNNLKYYRMHINGIASTPPITIEGSAVVTPSISGNADNIYIVYGMDDQLRVKRSTDGGVNWSLWTYFSLSTIASYVESVVSNEKLHVTYLESSIVKYRYRTETEWSDIKIVSDGETGNVPRITAYKNEQVDFVYFMYTKFNSVDYDCKWRRYNVTNNSWDSPLYTAPIANDFINVFGGFRVDNSNVVIYYRWHEYLPWYQEFFRWVILDLYNNWIDYGFADVNNNINDRMYSTPTTDGKTHTAFYFAQLGDEEYSDIGIWRSNMVEDRPTDQIYDYGYILPEEVHYINLSSAANEVHVIWKDEYGNNNGNNLRYKYDDQVPLAPTNFAGTTYNNHPKLTWTLNNEPDMSGYEIYRLLTSGSGEYELLVTVSSGTSSYVDNGVQLGGRTAGKVFYKIRAKDNHPYYSAYTNTIIYAYSGLNKVTVENQSIEYQLSANYPNPFNPSTEISYSLAQDADVTLKVYDMLGTEVDELVNETQLAGSYEINFIAENLSSGVYIYRITATNDGRILFTDSKQMLLMK